MKNVMNVPVNAEEPAILTPMRMESVQNSRAVSNLEQKIMPTWLVLPPELILFTLMLPLQYSSRRTNCSAISTLLQFHAFYGASKAALKLSKSNSGNLLLVIRNLPRQSLKNVTIIPGIRWLMLSMANASLNWLTNPCMVVSKPLICSSENSNFSD